MRPSISDKLFWLVVAAVLCAVCMWTYSYRVLIAHQVRDSTVRGTPRGNLSDLYPRWLGARELLLHGRDPYSPEFTREIQTGYYGRPLDPEGAGDRNYQQGFYYPVYVAFFWRPPSIFHLRRCERDFPGSCSASLSLLFRFGRGCCHWSVPLWGYASLAIFTIGSLVFVEGLLLQQITLFVFPTVVVRDAPPRGGSCHSRRRFAGIHNHQAATSLAFAAVVDDLDPRRLASPLPLGGVVSNHHVDSCVLPPNGICLTGSPVSGRLFANTAASRERSR
jgi:hypothetical protein